MDRKPGKTWYKEQLKKPEWKAKRREIYERDGFACVDCGDERATINCHHKYYVKGKKPWEYPEYALVTVCKACHEKRHRSKIIQHATHEDAEMWILFAEIEEAMVDHELDLRRRRIHRLEDRGAVWEPNGRFYGLIDKKGKSRFFDEDGNEM